MIQIYDNIISSDLVDLCEQYFTSPEMYYTYYTKTTEDDISDLDKRIKDINLYDSTQPVFVSHIIEDNKNRLPKSAELIRKLLNEIKEKTGNKFFDILRAQVNYTHPTVSGLPSVPHVDRDNVHTVLIYYITDSDGDTIFYDNECNVIKTCSPVKGRFVIFNGETLHSGTPPKKNNSRFVINMNLKDWK